MNSPVCVRFAPSPTGYLHVGGARTALFNYLFARRHGGRFVLRIEDTDVERSTQAVVDQILEAMKWLGLDWDGEVQYQSQRLDLYRAEAQRLLESGHAYRCFCTKERLESLREEAARQKKDFVYDGTCLRLDRADADSRASSGEPFVLRLHVPSEGVAVVEDLIRGTVKVDRALLGDFVLTRPDGWPTFNFANVVDDHDMGITHVIRGEDHLPNTPRHIMLYKALGYDVPQFAHLPMILGPDKQKLSKRHGAVSVMAYRDEGFLPEAMVNFLALLGWSLDDKTEVFSMQELTQNFSIERCGKSGAVFNVEKLQWLNGVHLRQMGRDEAVRRVREFMSLQQMNPGQYDETWLDAVIALQIERARSLKDLVENMQYFLTDDVRYVEKDVEKHLKKPEAAKILEEWAAIIGQATDFSHDTLEPQLRALSESLGMGFGKIVQPCRVALTGSSASPGIFEVLELLGKDRVLKRLAHARQNLV